MNDIRPGILAVPLIASVCVVLLYIFLLNRAPKKAVFKVFSLFVLVLGFLLNFAWEELQLPLYKGAAYTIQHISLCALAAVADGMMVVLLYFCFALIYKKPLWTMEVTLPRIVLLMLVGSLGAIEGELRYLSSGTWAYASSMPILSFMVVNPPWARNN